MDCPQTKVVGKCLSAPVGGSGSEVKALRGIYAHGKPLAAGVHEEAVSTTGGSTMPTPYYTSAGPTIFSHRGIPPAFLQLGLLTTRSSSQMRRGRRVSRIGDGGGMAWHRLPSIPKRALMRDSRAVAARPQHGQQSLDLQRALLP